MTFEDLRLVEPILRAVRTQGYTQPTPIQRQALPHVLAGRDVLGCAQTGTGKTAAFALPMIQRLAEGTSANIRDNNQNHDSSGEQTRQRSHRRSRPEAPRNGHSGRNGAAGRRVRALVLCPTRELAAQIHESFEVYGRHTDIRQTVIFGGVNQNTQVRALQRGVDVLVATPGRLLDLLNQRLVDLSAVEILVLDEADRMLDMGFLPDIRRVLKVLPPKRQNLLFSATMPPPIRKLADDILCDAAAVQVDPVSSAAPSVSHWVHHVTKADKPMLLTHLLHDTPFSRVLVFTRTKHGADKVVRQLNKAGLPAAAIHGNKSQNARTRALAEFRSGKSPVLVATDIAARGIDVDDISHVINFDLTTEPEVYVHRIGRTGRAGATGMAVSFCAPEDHDSLRAIERLIDNTLKQAETPAGFRPTQPVTAPAPRRTAANGSSRHAGQQRSNGNQGFSRGAPHGAGSARAANTPRRRSRRRSRSSATSAA